MPTLEFTPEQREIILNTPGPVSALLPETQQQYVIIARQTLEKVQSGVIQQLQDLVSGETSEKVEHTFYDFRDTPDEP